MANEEVINMIDQEEEENPNVAYIVNIKYFPNRNPIPPKKGSKKEHQKTDEELFENYILDIPPKILEMREKNNSLYLDVVETFAYNTISKKTGREVAKCQIYLSDIKKD